MARPSDPIERRGHKAPPLPASAVRHVYKTKGPPVAIAYVLIGFLAGALGGFTAGNAVTTTRIVTRAAAPDRVHTLGQLAAHFGKPLNTFPGTDIGLKKGVQCEQWTVIPSHLINIACWV